MKTLTLEKVRARLRARVNGAQGVWARANGIAPAYVSDVLNGRREPGKRMLEALGLKRLFLYAEDDS